MHTGADVTRHPLVWLALIGGLLCCDHRHPDSAAPPTHESAVYGGILGGVPSRPVANPPPAAALPRAEYAGIFSETFEDSSFVPCGTNDDWWLEKQGHIFGRFIDEQPALLDSAGRFVEPIYLRVIATPSATGNHGNLGAHSRRLDVDEVLDVHVYHAGDCMK
jgi:hypothetical protein